MSSIFGFYFVFGLLEHMGWPRRRSLFNPIAIVDSLILDSTIDQMIDWAASIGACRPDLALRVIATMFRENDWDSEESFNILIAINDSEKSWKGRGNTNPRDIVKPIRFSKLQKVVRAKHLKDQRIKTTFEQYFLEGLIWGLINSNSFKKYFETDEKRRKDNLTFYKEAGLEVDYVLTLNQFIKEGEEIIIGYEKEIRPLSPIPEKLMNDVISLGIDIKE
ncbi:hypothetical protein MUO66_08770 [Candidatus Bathyarchaeota archaeon]|nr:hypothetical protein [Candidatus Bathyarchaeota archaeon]